jgi:hypothetical protein
MRGNVGNVKYTKVDPASVYLFEFRCSDLFSFGKGFHQGNVILAIGERFTFRSYLQC